MMTQVPAPVFSQSATRSYDGTPESVRDLGHRQAFELDAATLSLTFTADSLPGEMALLTKDRSGASEGQFQILLINGVIHIEQESSTGGEWLKIPDLVVSAGTEYHIALSFGPDGLLFYVNGALAAAEPTFKYGMSSNIDHLLVGGSRAHRSSMEDTPHSVFKGEIGDVAIHSGQLSEGQIGHLASMAGVSGGHGHHGMMSSLAPAFEQMHHGSEWLQETAESYGMWQEHRPVDGVMMHGPSRMLDMLVGTPNADTLEGDDGDNLVNGSGAKDDGINGLAGNDLLKGWAGDDVIQGGYGNDTVEGGLGNDILMGGHGEDVLRGGRGDDWLISLSDAREQTPYYIPGRDEGDPYNELTNGKLYPDQPIPGDDVMEGGWGADIFYFQTLINAKERYIEKHTNDDGVINWHGVAGENDKLHDHWVDMLGNDVILDYRYSEGDRIVIEGHTTEIASITYGDENGDGVMDYSLIELYSDQGNNGGAHQYDRLGTIKVYGELVKWGDVHVDDDPAYGIVHDIAQLDEAIAPTFESVEAGPINAPNNLPKADKLPIKPKPVLSLAGEHELSTNRGDYLDVGHSEALEVGNATVALRFKLDWLPGNQALIAKDIKGRNEGDFSVWSRDGQLWVRQESEDKDKWLKVPDLVLNAGQEYHLAVSFGDDGIMVYLDGKLAASEPTFKQGLEENDNALTVGATRASRDADDLATEGVWGTIEDVHVFKGQLNETQVAKLAGYRDKATRQEAQSELDMAALAPVLEQTHHGSDWLMMTAMRYGMVEAHEGHGDMGMGMGDMGMGDGMEMASSGVRELNIMKGTPDRDTIEGDDTINGARQDDGIIGLGDDDLLKGWNGDDVIQGNYGNDTLEGGRGNDILDGGHGEDTLRGGLGDDWLISRGDAREPKPYNIPDRDEGDPYNELTNGKLYPDQPIPGDDLMEGGRGADIFYFQTLINAKEYYIEKHTNDDGVINWHGVAGENDNIHDHWVDRLGNDVIRDYSYTEGDRIVIEGHTTYIDEITYGDQNGDGIYDYSLIELYSDQGRNGGAHHLDRLGTIKVYGELVKESDILHTAAPAYGIVNDIGELREAIAPLDEGTNTGRIRPPKDLPDGEHLELDGGIKPVLAVPGEQHFDNEERSALVFAPEDETSNTNGTISFSFSTDEMRWQALFSKDSSGEGAGHIAMYIEEDGDLILRVQEAEETHYYSARNAIEAGQTYDVAVNFGNGGVALWLDGVRVAYDVEVKQGLNANNEYVVVGATGWSSTAGTVDNIGGYFSGTISDFAMYDRVAQPDELASNSSREGIVSLPGRADTFSFSMVDGQLEISRDGQTWEINPDEARYLEFNDITVAVSDVEIGGSQDEQFYGDQGSDILRGRGGNDRLEGRDNDDLLIGDAGDDDLFGGDGRDRLIGGSDDDYLDGGDQNDRLFGGDGYDELKGNDGNDRLSGGVGDDTLYGSGWADDGADETDTAIYNGNFADYEFAISTHWNGTRGANYDRITITDDPRGGFDGVYEGRDQLIDIDKIQFADQTVNVSDLVF